MNNINVQEKIEKYQEDKKKYSDNNTIEIAII